jgi:hypothetical protein
MEKSIKKENKKLRVCLYIDDQRTPTETIPGYNPWNVVRNYNEFEKHIIENGIPDLISFDHDLAKEHMDDYFDQFMVNGFQHPRYDDYKEKTGLDCAKFLVEYSQKMKVPLKGCAVHSHNPVGAKNIQSFINGFNKHMGWEETCYIGKFPFTVENK